jgi:CDGSH-type Zn-finger protein
MTDQCRTRPARTVSVEQSPDGPLLVRGADAVTGPDGEPVAVTRPVVAVCTCGKSQRLPWCDDTHRVIAG